MGFSRLLGNTRLKENLHNSINAGRAAHFYLISGPRGSGKHTLANLLAAALQCESAQKPCLTCNACRKVLSGTHPDYITIDDPEKKTVPVDLVRSAREDMFVRPNEGKKKIYLFPRGQDMLPPSQNALLKILEEPPSYGVFLLLTDNPEKLLPTVRSRCMELSLSPLSEGTLRQHLAGQFPQADSTEISAAIARSGGWLGQAAELLETGTTLYPETEKFLAAFAEKSALGLVQTLVPMERYKRDKLIPILEQWAELLEQALVCHSGMESLWKEAKQLTGRNSRDLLSALRQVRKCIEYAQGNVSPAAICGHLAWALR